MHKSGLLGLGPRLNAPQSLGGHPHSEACGFRSEWAPSQEPPAPADPPLFAIAVLQARARTRARARVATVPVVREHCRPIAGSTIEAHIDIGPYEHTHIYARYRRTAKHPLKTGASWPRRGACRRLYMHMHAGAGIGTL